MQIRLNEKRTHKVVNETVNGLNVVAQLVASANNTDIIDTQYMTGTAFDPSNVHIDVQLKRDGKIYNMISTNLALLAHFNTIAMGGDLWQKGRVTVKKGAAVKQQLERSVFIPFYGHHNVKGSDELIVTVHCTNGVFGTGVDKQESSLLVTANQSIGVETAIYSFHTYALQASMSDENVNLGDNVQRVALLSFETDALKPITKTISISSDRLDFTITEAELHLKHQQFFPYNYADYAVSNLGLESTKKYYPNTYLVHDKDEIDQAKLKISLHSANVKSSENIIAWITFDTSREILVKATEMAQRHASENLAKVPETLT